MKARVRANVGGFRVIYYHLEKNAEGITILLTNIYNKSELGTIKKADAIRQLENVIKEYRQQKKGNP